MLTSRSSRRSATLPHALGRTRKRNFLSWTFLFGLGLDSKGTDKLNEWSNHVEPVYRAHFVPGQVRC